MALVVNDVQRVLLWQFAAARTYSLCVQYYTQKIIASTQYFFCGKAHACTQTTFNLRKNKPSVAQKISDVKLLAGAFSRKKRET